MMHTYFDPTVKIAHHVSSSFLANCHQTHLPQFNAPIVAPPERGRTTQFPLPPEETLRQEEGGVDPDLTPRAVTPFDEPGGLNPNTKKGMTSGLQQPHFNEKRPKAATVRSMSKALVPESDPVTPSRQLRSNSAINQGASAAKKRARGAYTKDPNTPIPTKKKFRSSRANVVNVGRTPGRTPTPYPDSLDL